MAAERGFRGDAIPPDATVLELQLSEVKRLFNTMDPAPFHERDLDPNAEEYIVEWARESRSGQPLGLIIQLARDDGGSTALPEAIRKYFAHRAAAERRQLRQLLRTGRKSLLIGLLFLAAAFVVGDLIAGLIDRERSAYIVKETFVIGGWVALWRPLEIFLYDWWPILAEARLYDRLSTIAVQVRNGL